MGFTALGSIGFCTETDGSDAWCFGDTDYLYFGTDRDAKMAWVSDSVVFTTDLDIVGAVDITGSLAFSGALAVTGNLTADGTLMELDGLTSVKLLSAGYVDIESKDIRLGLDATHYMKLVTTTSSGNLAITHPGKTPAVTWTAASLTFTGAFEVEGASTFDAITGVGNLDINGTTALIDGSTSVRGISAGFVSLESATSDIRLGFDDSIYTKFSIADTTGNLTITHVGGSTDLVTWTAGGGFNFVGAFETDAITGVGNLSVTGGTTALITGSTSARLTSTTLASVEAANVRLGVSDTIYMDFDVSPVSGDVAITHTGSNKDVTWAAKSLDFTGDFTADGAAMIVDGSATCDILGETRVDIESPLIYLGRDADDYMLLTTADTTGNLDITHQGTPAVTWAANSFAFTGTFDITGAATFDAITSIGNLSVDGTTVLLDGATSVRGVSAGFVSLESATADIRLGFDDSIYTKFSIADTTGNLTITHVGGSTDLVTWTAAGGFNFVGAFETDALTLSDVLTFSGGGTMDNTAADTITITEDNIVLTGGTGVTVTDTGPFTVGPDPVVLNHRSRVTVAQINAGHELMPAVAGRTYRIIDVVAIAYGGAVGTTTTVDILGTQSSGSVKLFTFAQAQLTQSATLTIDSTGVVVTADGASFTACDAATAITVGKTGGDADTATGVDFIITYVLE